MMPDTGSARMATAANRVVLTYEHYLELPNDGKRYEIIEGELYVRWLAGGRLFDDAVADDQEAATDGQIGDGCRVCRVRHDAHQAALA